MTSHPLHQISRCPVTLAMDIGTGTKDVLHFSPGNTLENNIKLVVPTPALLMANALESCTGDLSVAGYTMGGGYLAKVLKKHVQKGHRVVMETLPAFTVRNNLEEVRAAGIEVVEQVEHPSHHFDEIELPLYFDLLERFGEDPSRIAAIGLSVQDHGYNTSDESSRHNRFRYFLDHLAKDQLPRSLVFTSGNLPEVFGRLKSGALCVSRFNPALRVVLIDTSFSAILGCALDPRVAAIHGPVLYINFGNGHVMACILDQGRIRGFFEHHTRILKNKPEIMKGYMTRLAEGTLPSEEVFHDDGNGCVTFDPLPFSRIAGCVVTGPQRHLMAKTGLPDYLEAAPGGDMMMTGPLGILRGMSLLPMENPA
ncbi:MAG: DUF1786 domain-containing protein [Candidatus Riflebacteria bacterium]|nr:DUF1786 domain-containing protein [Candidatus Riflebacteria bacterium]